MAHIFRRFAPALLALALAAGAPSARADGEPPSYDYINWQSVPSMSPDPGTETYLRSFSETVNGTLTTHVIESFWSGGDGYMYVNVVAGNAFIGTFRYPTEATSGIEYPSTDGWTPPSNDHFYDTIPGVPEPESVALLASGLAVVAWQLRPRTKVASHP
ncbi:MAG: hypothetical protein HYX44_13980 [Aquabacterium sp.]|nr:hypothetical protein [Aquabacterium sp.]